jgi:hypothetical protein
MPATSSPDEQRYELAHQSLTEVASRLSSDVAALARGEIELAKQQANKTVGILKAEAAGAVVSAILLQAGVMALVAAGILALALLLPAWAAALLVGVVLLAAGALLLLRARAGLSQIGKASERAVANVSRDVNAIKEAAR